MSKKKNSFYRVFEIIPSVTPNTVASLKDSGFTKVTLAGNYITVHAPGIAAAFKGTGVKEVDLRFNSIAAHTPATVAAFKDTGVREVNLGYNAVTYERDLKCLDIIWDDGQIYRLGIDYYIECGELLRECITIILHNEFKKQGFCGEDLLFPNVIQNLISEYATIDLEPWE